MKDWLEHIDWPERILGALLACGALLALVPRFFKVTLALYHNAKFTIDMREHLEAMEKRLIDRLTKLDDGQRHAIETRRQMLDLDVNTAWFETDPSGRTTYVSETWVQWTGIDRHAANGSGWELGIAPEDRPRVIQGWQQAVDHQREFQDCYHYVDRAGKRTLVDCVARPIRRKDKTILSYSGSSRRRGTKDIVLAAAEPGA